MISSGAGLQKETKLPDWPERDEKEFARGEKLLLTLELDAASFST